MAHLPKELVEIIASYLDIDNRRFLGVYKKIPLEKFTNIEKVLRKPSEISIEHYDVYNLPDLDYVPTRKEQSIDNDNIYICVKIRNDVVKYDFGLYRLKKKTDEPKYRIFGSWKGNLDDYYWDFITYQYTLK